MDPNKFEDNCSQLLQVIMEFKKIRPIQYLVAIGTFVNRPELRKYRNMDIENITNSLNTIKAHSAIIDSTSRIVDGIALFCDWETDKNEWSDFSELFCVAPLAD